MNAEKFQKVVCRVCPDKLDCPNNDETLDECMSDLEVPK